VREQWESRGFRRSDSPRFVNGVKGWTADEFFKAMTSFDQPPGSDGEWLLMQPGKEAG
jgi:hypothetical protein